MYTDFHGEIHENKAVDEILREYFPDYNYKGIFFDVGAFQPIVINNSYHFEKNGWECYCFEANTNQIPSLKEHRKNVFNYAISNIDKKTTTFNVVTINKDWEASYSAIEISEDYKRLCGWNPDNVTEIKVPQRTLNTVINTEIGELDKIDILSVDVEGGELNCLHGLDLKKYKPHVIVIENFINVENIQNYVRSFGYILDKSVGPNQFYISDNYSIDKVTGIN